MACNTYGDKPIVFGFNGLDDGNDDDTEYMIGSEVGNYMRLFRGALYKRYPGLTRRNLTSEERRKLIDMGHSQHVTASSVCLVLAKEVEEILAGRDEPYKTSGRNDGASVVPDINLNKSKPKPANYAPSMPNSSHLDAVPQASPINRNRVIHKKVRTFPLCFDDTEPATIHENAAHPEYLVPIRLDMDSAKSLEILFFGTSTKLF